MELCLHQGSGHFHPGVPEPSWPGANEHPLPCPSSLAGGVGWQSPTPGHPHLLPWTALSSASLQDERFKAHNLLEHRRLLWHGTNVAVIAAILKSGLRIMPHSGGRVGKGIYFASENSKSACYGEGPGPTEFVGAHLPSHTPCQAATGHAKPLPCMLGWPDTSRWERQG